MTMPHERTRSLLWAGELLRKLRSGDLTPEQIRHQAHVILRHYPSPTEIDAMALTTKRDVLGRIKDSKAVDTYAPPAPESGSEGRAVQTDKSEQAGRT